MPAQTGVFVCTSAYFPSDFLSVYVAEVCNKSRACSIATFVFHRPLFSLRPLHFHFQSPLPSLKPARPKPSLNDFLLPALRAGRFNGLFRPFFGLGVWSFSPKLTSERVPSLQAPTPGRHVPPSLCEACFDFCPLCSTRTPEHHYLLLSSRDAESATACVPSTSSKLQSLLEVSAVPRSNRPGFVRFFAL